MFIGLGVTNMSKYKCKTRGSKLLTIPHKGVVKYCDYINISLFEQTSLLELCMIITIHEWLIIKRGNISYTKQRIVLHLQVISGHK